MPVGIFGIKFSSFGSTIGFCYKVLIHSLLSYFCFRYPVVLRTFSLNPGTGGRGKCRGGDGIIRETLFRKNLTLSVLTERRVYQPYGLNGLYSELDFISESPMKMIIRPHNLVF